MTRKSYSRTKKRKSHFRRRTKPGAAPGTIRVHPDAEQPVMHVIAYGAESFAEGEIGSVGEIGTYLNQHAVTWINVDGLGSAATIRQLGERFNLHALSLEDVVNVHQRAKVEPYEQYIFLVSRMVKQQEQLETEQVSIFLGPNYVLSFQERRGDCFDPVRQRIRKSSGRIRAAGTDYLAYALVDAVVDSYFPVVDRYADRLDELDDLVLADSDPKIVSRLHQVRRDLLLLRRAVRPHREAINALIRETHQLMHDETRVYLRDCFDHTIQLMELLEVYRELCGDLSEQHRAMMSNRMNEIMKVLTIIATIFIPLSFIAGLYGMNFDTSSPWNMPELEWRWGYPFALGLMLSVAGGMLAFFRRRGWIGRSRRAEREKQE